MRLRFAREATLLTDLGILKSSFFGLMASPSYKKSFKPASGLNIEPTCATLKLQRWQKN